MCSVLIVGGFLRFRVTVKLYCELFVTVVVVVNKVMMMLVLVDERLQ